MTAFPGEPGAFQLLVEVPATRIEPTRVDEIPGRQRTPKRGQAVLQVREERREPPVEADHDSVVAALVDRFQNLGELIFAEGERLLDKNGAAALQGLADQAGMRVVPGDDEDRVERV